MLSHSVDYKGMFEMIGKYVIELGLLVLIWASGSLIDFMNLDWLAFFETFSSATVPIIKFAATVLIFATVYFRYRTARRQDTRDREGPEDE